MDQTRLLTTSAEYDHAVFHELNPFEIAKACLAKLRPAVTTLGDIVCEHGLQSSVGASLIHKHFDLGGDELIVRRFQGRTATMRPTRPDSFQELVIPYVWTLAEGNRGRQFYPVEFVEYEGHILPNAVEEITLIASNHRFLRDIATCLWDLGLEDVFGITALCSRYRFELRNGETMLESTDSASRTLTLEPIDEALLDAREATETLWVFSRPNAEAVLV